MKTFVTIAIFILLPLGILRAEERSAANAKTPTEHVAFAQSCFWTGEMELGQIEGVVRTEAGFFQGREVTLVDYDPARISVDKLALEAKRAGVADRIHLTAGSKQSGSALAGVTIGARLDRTYRTAPASDQKKQLEGTPYAHLKLTPEQATKVNAFARANPAKAREWLAPAQREKLAAAR